MIFYLSALLLGLCLSAMGLGIFITMKIFRIPDITTDGSYTLGAAVTAVLLTQDLPIVGVIGIVMAAGALAGVATGLVHTRLKIDALLAGILVMTGLYSVNLTILGRSNIPLLEVDTIFKALSIFGKPIYNELWVGILFLSIISLLLAYMLRTDFGIAIIDDNPLEIFDEDSGRRTIGACRFDLVGHDNFGGHMFPPGFTWKTQ